MFPLSTKILEKCLPHRDPMIWISQVDWVREDAGECTVVFDSKAAYCSDGKVVQGAYIEWMAQASGYCAAARTYLKTNGEATKMNETYLVGLRETTLYAPRAMKDGTLVKVGIELLRDLAPLALIKGTVKVDGDQIAQATLKVYFT